MKYEIITVWPHPFSMSSEWFFCGSHCWQPVNPTSYFLWIFLWFLTQDSYPDIIHWGVGHKQTLWKCLAIPQSPKSSPTPPARGQATQSWQNRYSRTIVWEGPCPPQHTFLQERARTHLDISRHIEWIIVPAYKFTLGWWGSKRGCRCFIIPSGAKKTILWRETFPNCKMLT